MDNKKIENKENLINDLVIDIKSSSKNNTNEKVFSNIGTKGQEIRSRNISIANKSIMPDLAGKSMRDAIALLNQLGLEYKIIGNGRVVSQSIGAGSPIIPGATCLLKCESKPLTVTQVK